MFQKKRNHPASLQKEVHHLIFFVQSKSTIFRLVI